MTRAKKADKVGWPVPLGEATNQPSGVRMATIRTDDETKCSHRNSKLAGIADGREHWRCDDCSDVLIKDQVRG